MSLAMVGVGGTALADPAPPGSAEATVAEVDGVVEVSGTEANAGPSGGDADATVLGVGGEQVIGSTQEGDGTSEDAVLDTGDTPLGRLTIGPSSASVDSDDDGTNSAARTALVDLTVIDENTVALTLAESISEASWTELLSSGHAETTVLQLGLFGELDIAVLHSETDGQNSGSYLARINDTAILSSEQVDGNCMIEIPEVLSLQCLTASGGAGATGVAGSAAGATADVLSGSITGDVASSQSASGSGEAAEPEVSDDETGRSGPADTGGGALPRTGFELMTLTGIAGALIAGGSALLRRRNAREATAAS
jgi:hypothetical protein